MTHIKYGFIIATRCGLNMVRNKIKVQAVFNCRVLYLCICLSVCLFVRPSVCLSLTFREICHLSLFLRFLLHVFCKSADQCLRLPRAVAVACAAKSYLPKWSNLMLNLNGVSGRWSKSLSSYYWSQGRQWVLLPRDPHCSPIDMRERIAVKNLVRGVSYKF